MQFEDSGFKHRMQEALRIIDPLGNGLEFGPLDKPLVSKQEFVVKYADHLPVEQLRQKYLSNDFVDLATIHELDYVTNSKPLTETITEERFTYIVASHVVEHVPDFISFIRECLELLRPGGVLSLVAPDKRYSFDVQRRLTTFGDLYAAFIENRRSPTIRDICDHYFEVVKASPPELWRGVDSSTFEKYHTPEEAFCIASQAKKSSWKVDCHVWVFTHDTFASLLQECQSRRLLTFEIAHSSGPILNELDFFYSLRKPCIR